MLDFAAEAMEVFETHLRFIVVAAVLSLVGRFVKKYIFTKKRASGGNWFWLWMRRTLPLHPVLVAWGFGLFVGRPYYFVFAGFVSIWFFDVLKAITKRQADFELEVFTDSTPPEEVQEAITSPKDAS